MNVIKAVDENYAFRVVQLPDARDVGLDKLHAFDVFGYQVLTSKTTESGSVVVYVPAGARLHHDVCHIGNLYRDSSLNKEDKAGYIEPSRRVKTLKLKNLNSTGILLPVAVFNDNFDVNLKVGDVFDSIGDKVLIKKYTIKEPKSPKSTSTQNQRDSHWVFSVPVLRHGALFVSKIFNYSKTQLQKKFPKHFKTLHFNAYVDAYKDGAVLAVSQKLHGTSVRFAYIESPSLYPKIKRFINSLKRFVNPLGGVSDDSYKLIIGSREVIKNGKSGGYYGSSDIWTETVKQLTMPPKDYYVFGEIVGYSGDRPIQKGYTYNQKPTEAAFYCYRVFKKDVNDNIIELNQAELSSFCTKYNYNRVPLLFLGNKEAFIKWHESINDTNFSKQKPTLFVEKPVGLDASVDEGYCIRCDEPGNPFITKLKFAKFLSHEEKDENLAADMEAEVVEDDS